MAKLRYISWATVLLILGGANINFASASTDSSQPPSLRIAHKSSGDETIDAIQERDKKVESGLNKIRKLTGTEKKSKPEPEPEEDLSPEEMIDALQNRQEKLEKLKELKQLKDLAKNKAILESLQAENLKVDDLEQLEVVRNVVDNPSFSDEEMLEILQGQDIKIENLKQIEQLKKIAGKKTALLPEDSPISGEMAFKMLVIGVPATILLVMIGKPIVGGVVKMFGDNYQEKFGKPKVPEGSLNLHARAYKEITNIGTKAEKINNDKFGNEEFLLLLRIKIGMKNEAEGYQGLGNCVDLLQAGIIAQKSFLRLEQTELRYRSRKQQELYGYVAENLQGEIDRADFVAKIKKKKAEILPLVTTEEGRDAVDSYTKELNNLSKYELGLKLLSLFKQYELDDFSILKNISDVVETLEGKDLVNSDDLVSPVLEHYESFEKLGPIIGIAPAQSTPQAYAKILQVIGLTSRHGKSYLQFAQLVSLLKKWEKPYKAMQRGLEGFLLRATASRNNRYSQKRIYGRKISYSRRV